MIGYKGLIEGYKGLVIDKSTSLQTICQTIKCYIGIGGYPQYREYLHYHRYKGLSIYRRKAGIPHSETLDVSYAETQGEKAGNIKNIQISLLAYIKHIKDIKVCMV